MDLPGAAVPQFIDGIVLQLCAPDNRILADDDAVIFDYLFDGISFIRATRSRVFWEGGV